MFGFLFAGRRKASAAAVGAAQPAVVGDGAASDTSSSSVESPTYDWDQMTRVSLAAFCMLALLLTSTSLMAAAPYALHDTNLPQLAYTTVRCKQTEIVFLSCMRPQQSQMTI
jgi:hypothetical protein